MSTHNLTPRCASELGKKGSQKLSQDTSQMQSSDNTLSKTQTDEEIKQTFNMLMERISNVEDLLQEQRRTSQEQRRASIFAECIKYGRLNNVLLGYPFDITRRLEYFRPDIRNQDDPPPSMKAIFIFIDFLMGGCTFCPGPASVERVAGKEVASVVYSTDDRTHPSEIGWMESRFAVVEEEATQRLIDPIFETSSFHVKLCWDGDCSVRYHLSPKEPGIKVQLLDYLKEVPNLVKANGCCVNCISEIDITTDSDPDYRIVEAIQYAANLRDGPLKEEWTRERDLYAPAKLGLLSSKRQYLSIHEVYDYIQSRGHEPGDDEDSWTME